MAYDKGEWKYSEDREGNPGVGLYFLGEMSRIHAIIAKVFGKDREEAEANAHLIAAAPAMYEALKGARDRLELLNDKTEGFRLEMQIQQALAKAEGK
ncbi:hypothetical protein LCGC14_1974220 [marine sediment metagenome]|uniref:Uncharacterized protein n=1 Tax=marine sediment metagenome TaxID=412755 RepID=A0A0F9FB84_9ZZZZ